MKDSKKKIKNKRETVSFSPRNTDHTHKKKIFGSVKCGLNEEDFNKKKSRLLLEHSKRRLTKTRNCQPSHAAVVMPFLFILRNVETTKKKKNCKLQASI